MTQQGTGHRWHRLIAAIGCGLLWLGVQPAAAAETTAATPPACGQRRASPDETGGDYTITRARSRTRAASIAVCDVAARTAAREPFELSMPSSGWNRALVETRCNDGACAPAADAVCDNIVARGYACLVGAPASATAAHEVLVAAKSIVAAHYRASPSAAVLLACSTGAGTGLHQAAQFPADFQGIVAGAPILDEQATRRRTRWLAESLRAPGGRPLLGPRELARLQAGALAACDAQDGLGDGLISDPLRCRFSPRALQCAQASDPDCLGAAQVEAAERIYAGPPDDPSGGALPGSEAAWMALVATADRGGSAVRATSGSPAVTAGPPDLEKFAAAGGKLLLFQGLADPLVAPRKIAEMYESWARALGGTVKASTVARLFMIPGMQHCTGGSGPYRIDFLSSIENWVIKPARRAPDDFIAFRPRSDPPRGENRFAPSVRDPAQQVFSSWQVGVSVTMAEARDQRQSSFSRPIYLYPVHTHYKGVGDPDYWRSFYGPNDYPYLLK
jgi:feruloyl esterase